MNVVNVRVLKKDSNVILLTFYSSLRKPIHIQDAARAKTGSAWCFVGSPLSLRPTISSHWLKLPANKLCEQSFAWSAKTFFGIASCHAAPLGPAVIVNARGNVGIYWEYH